MPEYAENRLKAISIIESLRSGVPSRRLTGELPDLRPQVLELIRSDLETLSESGQVPAGRLIWAEYGQGKSHFLRMVENLTLEMNFAVSYVTLNRQVSLNNLTKFFQVTAPFIRTPKTDIPGLMNQLLQKNHTDLPLTPIQEQNRYSHPLPAVILECLLHTSEDDFNQLYHHLMGDFMPIAEIRHVARENNLSHLFENMERFRQEHIPVYFAVLADITHFCGYKGWIILIDEAELIGRLGRQSRLKAYRNLNWLLNWNNGAPYPIYTIAAVASSLMNDLWLTDGRGDMDIIPKIAAERLGNKAQVEMTTFFQHAALSNECPKLIPVNDSEIRSLLSKICETYCQAYDHNQQPSPEWLDMTLGCAKGRPIRTYIRAGLEILDHYFLTGQIIEVPPANLIEHTMEEEKKLDNNEAQDI